MGKSSFREMVTVRARSLLSGVNQDAVVAAGPGPLRPRKRVVGAGRGRGSRVEVRVGNRPRAEVGLAPLCRPVRRVRPHPIRTLLDAPPKRLERGVILRFQDSANIHGKLGLER